MTKIDISKYKSPGIYTAEWDINDIRPYLTEDIVEHINNLYKMLGSDMTFDKWNNMKESERSQFERDLKLKILNI